MNSNDIILHMIENGSTVNEICERTKLSNKQLFYRLNLLKLKGYCFNTKYYSDGEIVYNLIKNINLNKEDGKSIIMNTLEDSIKLLFVSDIHIGSKLSDVKYINIMYDYCKKNNINIIVNAGDLVNGSFNQDKENISDLREQIDYFLKIYPFDKNILTFICYGNHDYQVLNECGINISCAINNKRNDIISLGYGLGKLNIQNDQIIIKHPMTPSSDSIKNLNNKLVIYGHSHETKYGFYYSNKLINIFLPPLSNVTNSSGFLNIPGMIEANIKLTNGIFNKGNFKHLIINDKVYKISEVDVELLFGRNIPNGEKINNVENRIRYEKTLMKKL